MSCYKHYISLIFTEKEDYPLHLQYSGGDSICSGGKKAKVVHKFKCAHIMSPPTFERYAVNVLCNGLFVSANGFVMSTYNLSF